ncbi:OsmC family protein [Thalassotalea agarivorans]|uniref:Putative redox protein n=1 Tax=Thalassotalea agarivorans TaxID=349064 RepID=A0A1I0H0Y7_THASX|nr:OsmC family protein [Thalassotalea agarivorans]SET77353.1 putative redox protein [Thalassotalea agarivorans]
MKATVKWVGEETFMGISESGHSLILDANGGKTAPSPLENVLLSLGGCSSVDVVSILQKARQQVTGCEVHLEGKRVDTVPRLFSDIHLTFVITGTDVAEKHVERAVNLSADKYCSVALMLNKAVNITHSYEIVNS